MKTIITKVENNRVVKYQPIADADAQEKLEDLLEKYPNAFIYDGEYVPELWVENGIVSIVQVQLSMDERKAEKQSEINALEASQYMTRGEREGWLAMIEAQAAAQSVPLDVLYAANPFYKKLKDVNTAVTSLRAELKAIV